MKKWKIGIVTQSSSTTYTVIEARTATDALKLAKMQFPNARNYTTPTEVK
jgi:hypothetical protein